MRESSRQSGDLGFGTSVGVSSLLLALLGWFPIIGPLIAGLVAGVTVKGVARSSAAGLTTGLMGTTAILALYLVADAFAPLGDSALFHLFGMIYFQSFWVVGWIIADTIGVPLRDLPTFPFAPTFLPRVLSYVLPCTISAFLTGVLYRKLGVE